jgi:hypothetical protein
MKAKNPKNNKNFNKAVQWLTKHNILNDQRTLLEDTSEAEYVEDTTAWKRINKKCEDSFDKYMDYCYELPKTDVKTIEKTLW